MRFRVEAKLMCSARDEQYTCICDEAVSCTLTLEDSGTGGLAFFGAGSGASVQFVQFGEKWPEGWSKVHQHWYCPNHQAQAAYELKKTILKKDYVVTTREVTDKLIDYFVEHLGQIARVPKEVVAKLENV